MAWVTLSVRKRELKQEHTHYQLEDLKISRQKRQLARRKQYEQSLIQLNQKKAIAPLKQAYDDKIKELNENKRILSEYLAAAKKVANNSTDLYKTTNEDQCVYCEAPNGEYVININTKTAVKYDDVKDEADFKALYGDKRYNLIFDTREKLSDNTTANPQYTVINDYGLQTNFTDIKKENISELESRVCSIQSDLQIEIQQAYTDYTENVSAEKQIYEDEQQMLEDEIADEETALDLHQQDIELMMENISAEMDAIKDSVSNEMRNDVIQLK